MLTWFDLDAPIGLLDEPVDKRDASAMQLYDARHDLRVRAATGQAGTFPVRTQACDGCHWLARCLADAGPDSPSFALRQDSMKARDWIALDLLGVRTTRDLADIDLDDERLMGRFKRNCSVPSRGKKLDELALRADLIESGETLRRVTGGPLDVPQADLEIDIDYEWDTDDLTYLFGALVRTGTRRNRDGAGSYRHFSHFEPIDAAAELELTESFVNWLRTLIDRATGAGHSIRVFHYSHPELSRLKKRLGQNAVADLEPFFFDLRKWVEANFANAYGYGIKDVAPALGFTWRDTDPGGAQSQVWLQQARETDDPLVRAELTRRLLSYNEDDVLAQAAIRDAAREQWGS